MNGSFKFRMLWVLAFMLAAPWAMAQKDIPPYGFAGEDQTALAPAHGYTTVYLGLNEVYDNDDSYYEWKLSSSPADYSPPVGGPFGGNEHKCYTPARVSVGGDYVFELTRLSKYGYQKDEVLVSVKDRVTIISVKPKDEYECFKPEEILKEEYFDIITDPKDCSYLVVLADDSKQTVPVGSWSISEHQEIHFLVKRDENDPSPIPSATTCTITVFDEIDWPSAEFENNKIIEALKKFVLLGKKVGEIIADNKSLDKDGNLTGKPFEAIHEVDMSLQVKNICCDHVDGYYLDYGLKGKLGVGINWPIPIITGVYAIITGKIVGVLDLNGTVSLGEGSSICGEDMGLDFIISGDVGAGVGVGVPGTFNLEVVAKGGIEAKFHLATGSHLAAGAAADPQVKYVKANVAINLTLHYVIGSTSMDLEPFSGNMYLYGNED